MMQQKQKRNKQGSALIYVLCIMSVVVVLCLSLLAMSYSLFASSAKHKNQEQAQILAVSLSREIEDELCYNGGKQRCYWLIPYAANDQVDTTGKIYQCTDAGVAEDQEASDLMYYIARNIWTEGWTYYNEDERNHTLSDVSRYFDLSTANSKFSDEADGITVQMYWESDRDTASGADRSKKDATPLSIVVTSKIGSQSYIVTSNYILSMQQPASVGTDEIWQWMLSNRE